MTQQAETPECYYSLGFRGKFSEPNGENLVIGFKSGSKENGDRCTGVVGEFIVHAPTKEARANTLRRFELFASSANMRKLLEEFAKQKTTDELDAEPDAAQGDYGDIEGAYNMFIAKARAIIAEATGEVRS